MFCSNCGKEIDDNAKFCQFCGNKNNEINDEDKTFNENDSKKLYYDNFLHNIEQKITKVETTFEFKNIILTMPDIDTKKILLQGEIYKKNNMQINKIKIILSIPKGFFKYEKFECELDIEDVYFKIQVPFEILEKFSGSNLFLTVMPQIEHKINNNMNKNIPSKRNLGFGWLFGIAMLISGIGLSIDSSINPLGIISFILFGLLLIPPINQKIDILLKNRDDKKKIKIIIGFILFILMGVCGPREQVETPKQNNKPISQAKIHKAPIEDGALYSIPESYGKGYDKTIKRHGMANIKKSNLLLPKAANLAAQNSSCDVVTNVMLSDNKSTQDNLVILVDCKNGKRFYIPEKELSGKVPAKAENLKTNMKSPKRANLALLESHSCNIAYGGRAVCGVVQNNTDRTYSYVQVEINLYNNSGSLVGSTMVNVNNLEPSAQWQFEAPIIKNNATKFKVVNVTGF